MEHTIAILLVLVVILAFVLWSDYRQWQHKQLPLWVIDHNRVTDQWRVLERKTSRPPKWADPYAFYRTFPTKQDALDFIDGQNALQLAKEGWNPPMRTRYVYPTMTIFKEK